MISWHLEKRSLASLKDHPRNPRKLSKFDAEQLKKSLQKFGVIDKPVITSDGLIIGGHQRKRILRSLGIKEIECWVPDANLSEQDVDELNIRLNKNTGEFDFEVLANQWEMTDLLDWGFTADDFQLGEAETVDSSDEEDEQEALDIDESMAAKTQLGDIYELNGHRLVCGDSTLPDDVAKCLNGAEPILMVTDPPYGVEYDASWRDPSKIGSDGIRAKPKSTGKVTNDERVNWALAWHLFPGAVAYTWCASWFLPEVAKSLDEADFERKSLIIWAKQHFALSRGDYHWQHEPCWYAVRKGHNHNWQGSRKESTLWEISNAGAFGGSNEGKEEKTTHSTQKPLECMSRPIRNNSAPGEGVYDPFLGSGTTLIAAEQLGRLCYGIEISPHYCDIIVNRWLKFMRKHERKHSIKRNGEPCDWDSLEAGNQKVV